MSEIEAGDGKLGPSTDQRLLSRERAQVALLGTEPLIRWLKLKHQSY